MQIIKAEWVTHDGQPIYSVDLQRGDKRFVTGGQSPNGAGLVIIWNLASLLDKNVEDDHNIAKVLCKLESHTACVNCVRWSENGKYLASAGSDQTIMIWQYAGLNAFSVADKGNVETWKCTHVLRGHQGDILHLAWSPGDHLLASSSVDNTIIIWNADKFPSKVTTLEEHKGFVKGVTWDPLGVYLASQSDDKTMKVWSTIGWKCIMTLKTPFKESAASSTHFLRLDWSPDGATIAAVHSTNNGGPVAKLVARDSWTCHNEFVGHRKAISCSRFSPTLYSVPLLAENGLQNASELFTFCAIGSKDRTLSLWSTAFPRPLAVVTNLFAGNIMDISWSQTSCLHLIACAHDGTVALVEFTKEELGCPLDYSEKQNHLKKTYGVCAKLPSACIAPLADDENSLDSLIDDPKILLASSKLTENSFTGPSVDQKSPINVGMTKKNPQLSKTQIESRTKDGRRTIKPIFLGASVVVEDPALQESVVPQESAVPPVINSVETTKPHACNTNSIDFIKQLSCHQVVEESFLQTHANGGLKSSMVGGCFVDTTPEISEPKVARLKKKKRLRSVSILSEDENTANDEAEDFRHEKFNEHAALPCSSSKETLGSSQIKLTEPPLKKIISCSARASSKMAAADFICENDLNSSTSLVWCSQSSGLIWRTVVGFLCRFIGATEKFVVVCGDCCSRFNVLSTKTGRSEMPSVCLDSPACCLNCTDTYILIVTKKATVYVWVWKDSLRLICKQTLLDIGISDVSQDLANLSYARLTEMGDPIISLSCGSTYVYSCNCASWLVVSEKDDAVASSSYVKSPECGHAGNSVTQNTGNGNNLNFHTPPTHSFGTLSSSESAAMASVTFAEQQMQLYKVLHCQRDYEHWLNEFIRECVRQNQILKIRAACQELLEQIIFPAAGREINKCIDWRKILDCVLNIISKNVKLQRIFREFKDQLDSSIVSSSAGTIF